MTRLAFLAAFLLLVTLSVIGMRRSRVVVDDDVAPMFV